MSITKAQATALKQLAKLASDASAVLMREICAKGSAETIVEMARDELRAVSIFRDAVDLLTED